MELNNLRYVNASGGILATQVDGIDIYLDSSAGNMYALASAGYYGEVLPFVEDLEEVALQQVEFTKEQFRVAVQNWVDLTAQTRGYDSGVTCASYANSIVSTWSADATNFIQWRDSVWLYVYDQLQQVLDGNRTAPTIEGLIAELPLITWPT